MEPGFIIEDIDSLQAFIGIPKRHFGAGQEVYFKFHDDRDEAFVIADPESGRVIAETRRKAVLYFLHAYDRFMLRHRVDEQGWQYWSLELDAIDSTQRHEQIRLGIEIARLVEASSVPDSTHRRIRPPKKR